MDNAADSHAVCIATRSAPQCTSLLPPLSPYPTQISPKSPCTVPPSSAGAFCPLSYHCQKAAPFKGPPCCALCRVQWAGHWMAATPVHTAAHHAAAQSTAAAALQAGQPPHQQPTTTVPTAVPTAVPKTHRRHLLVYHPHKLVPLRHDRPLGQRRIRPARPLPKLLKQQRLASSCCVLCMLPDPPPHKAQRLVLEQASG